MDGHYETIIANVCELLLDVGLALTNDDKPSEVKHDRMLTGFSERVTTKCSDQRGVDFGYSCYGSSGFSPPPSKINLAV